MKLLTNDFETIRGLFKAIDTQLDDVKLEITKSGVRFETTDRAIVTMWKFELKPSFFEEYFAEKESFGLNLGFFLDKTNIIDKKSRVTIETVKNKLLITEDGEFTTVVEVPEVEVSPRELPNKDSLDFKTRIELKLDTFIKALDKFKDFDSVTFKKYDGGFSLSSEKTKVIIPIGNSGLISVAGENVKSRYSTEYLKFIKKLKKYFTDVVLVFNTDYPLKMVFIHEYYTLTVVLAPRVTED